MTEERTNVEKRQEIGREILVLARNTLYLKMRFLDVALSSFVFSADTVTDPAGTDGFSIFYHPESLGKLYSQDQVLVNRLYLHMVLHCLFHHLTRRNGRDKELWNIACDIVAESMIDTMQHRPVLRSRSFLRRETYRKLYQEMKVLTPEKVYGYLESQKLNERKLQELAEDFYADSHIYWPDDKEEERRQEIENQWQNKTEEMETDMETFSKEATSSSGNLLEHVKVENKERFQYGDFLRKFAVLREEMAVDEDSFDYSFYSYGLRLYGNMPLIEPQEWKETKKIEDFVIVIDTSMSCSGELVRKFLEETYTVLSEQNSFFRKVNIHIIQCDETIQSDQKITDGEELKKYMEDLELKGEGGTDFRPAFAYVEKLLGQNEFSQLRGLIYFTDGQGIYPKKMPPYETAFVFMKEDYEEVDVPSWAMKLILDEEDVRKMPGNPGERKGDTQWI